MSIRIAKQVLRHESQSILLMAKKLDVNFNKAVMLMHGSRWPVILIGMGKPAYIAQKISASLASTGTPSFTLHPADALHGDIGRVPNGAVILLLSNSGQTEEILKIIPPLKAIRCRIIALTGSKKSLLSKAADVVLDVSVVSEAKPLDVAPTASTTCMLAMGDALTMALVEKRRFKQRDFAMLHPGGSLGKHLRLSVKDVMRSGRRNPCVQKSISIRNVLIKITAAHAGSVTIVDSKHRCIGIFTDGDLRRNFRHLLSGRNVEVAGCMTKKPMTINQNTLASKALEIFRKKSIDEMPVVNNNKKVVGLLDVQDLLAQGFVLPS